MKNILIILAAVTLAGCGSPEQIMADRDNRIKAGRDNRISEMSFVKHPNGLCFAITESRSRDGWMIASVTNIPCISGDTVFVR